jgi:hypothetical protein
MAEPRRRFRQWSLLRGRCRRGFACLGISKDVKRARREVAGQGRKESTMTVPWFLTVGGLLLSTVAAWLMYSYPLSATTFTEKGEGEITFVSAPTPKGQHAFRHHQRLSRLGVGLLGLGFVLQLIGAVWPVALRVAS